MITLTARTKSVALAFAMVVSSSNVSCFNFLISAYGSVSCIYSFSFSNNAFLINGNTFFFTKVIPKESFKWLRLNTPMRNILECSPEQLGSSSKIFVNGNWIGVIDTPIEIVNLLKLYRRNGIIPVYTSISFNYQHNEVYIYTDAGRLSRPIYYVEDNKFSFDRKEVKELLDRGDISWEQIVAGFLKKSDENFKTKNNKIYEIMKNINKKD